MTKNTQLQPHSKSELLTSGAEKRNAYKAAPANPGMHHVAIPAQAGKPGLLATGVSRVEADRLLGRDQVGEVNVATLAKQGHKAGNVPLHPHVTAAQRANYRDNGGDVLTEAIAPVNGSTKLPSAINSTIDKSKAARLPDCPK
jgi:hypothetical protein